MPESLRRCPPVAIASKKSASVARAAQTPAASPAPASASSPQTPPDRPGTGTTIRRTQSPAIHREVVQIVPSPPALRLLRRIPGLERPPPTSALARLPAAPHQSPQLKPSIQPHTKVPQQSLSPTSCAHRPPPSLFFPGGTGTGTAADHHPHRESMPILPHSRRRSNLTKSLLNLRSLWRTGSFQPLVPCGQGRAFHTDPLLPTALFNPPVGDVGNQCHPASTSTPFSKTPDTHSPNLENCAPLQPRPTQSHRKLSHFSSPNGYYYYLFFYYPFRFPLPVAPSFTLATGLPILPAQLPSPTADNIKISRPPRSNRTFQRCVPVFHAHTNERVNTIKSEKSRPISLGNNRF